MGNEVSLSLSDIRGGAPAVTARLRRGAANPNKRLLFAEDIGPLPRGCKCTPLGYAILAGDAPLLDVLLAAGADPHKTVGLPHRFDFPPLHMACALGYVDAVKKLLAAGADPNAPLQLKRGVTTPPPHTDADLASSSSSSSTALLPVNLSRTRPGDAALHIAIDCAASYASLGNAAHATGGVEAIVEALITHPATNPNLPNARRRTPLYKAVKRGLTACVALLATHPRVDVNAGGPLFAAIMMESTEMLSILVQAGVAAGGSGIRSDTGQSPLWYALTRASLFFMNRADVVALLVSAGAVVEPEMLRYVEQRNWRRVQAVMEAAPARRSTAAGSTGTAAAAAVTAQRGSAAAGTPTTAPQTPPAGSQAVRTLASSGILSSLAWRRQAQGSAGGHVAASAAPASRHTGTISVAGGGSATCGAGGGGAAAAPPRATAANGSQQRNAVAAVKPPLGSATAAVLRELSRNPASFFFLPVFAPFILLLGLAEGLLAGLASLAKVIEVVIWVAVCAAAFCLPAGLYGLYRLVRNVARLLRFLVCVIPPRRVVEEGRLSSSDPAVVVSGGAKGSTGAGVQPEQALSCLNEANAPSATAADVAAMPGGAPEGTGVFFSPGGSTIGAVVDAAAAHCPGLEGSSTADRVVVGSGGLSAMLKDIIAAETRSPSPDGTATMTAATATTAATMTTTAAGSVHAFEGNTTGGIAVGDADHPAAPAPSVSQSALALLGRLWGAYLSFFAVLLAVLLAVGVATVVLESARGLLRLCLPADSPASAYMSGEDPAEERRRQSSRGGGRRTEAARQQRGTPRRRGDEWSFVPYYVPVALGLRWGGGFSFLPLAGILSACFVAHEVYGEYGAYRSWLAQRQRAPAQTPGQRRRGGNGGGVRGGAGGGGAADRAGLQSDGDGGRDPLPAAADAAADGDTGDALGARGAARHGGGSGGGGGGMGSTAQHEAVSGSTVPGGAGAGAGTEAGAGEGGSVKGGLEGLCCVCMSERAVMGFVHRDVVHCCLCCGCQAELQRRGQLRTCLMCQRPAVTLTRVVAT